MIPHFKEVVLMSFHCSHCSFSNNEIQSAAPLQSHGLKSTAKLYDKKDLNRQIVKSEHASLKFIELDFEIPSGTQRGSLNTVEGYISRAIEGLQQLLDRTPDHENFNQLQSIVETLNSYILDISNNPFTIVLDDPSGNSYIENFHAPDPDPKIQTQTYVRTRELNQELGYENTDDEVVEPIDDVNNEVHIFQGNCSRCNAPSDTRMHVMEVIIMATDCEGCGYKSNEVKAGGAISPYGKRITLRVQDVDDLNRDVLKSETCSLSIPEIQLDLTNGTLGGRFTTLEGLLTQVYDEVGQSLGFSKGDSAEDSRKQAMENFFNRLQKALKVENSYTVILDDPLGNSYLQNIYAPDADPNMTIETYTRSFDQNEMFGLNDLVLEGYEK